MNILDKLISYSGNSQSLTFFIERYNQDLYDYLLTQSYSVLKENKEDIDGYILAHLKVIKTLDFELDSTKVFISILLEAAERFSFFTSFQRLFNFLNRYGCEQNYRLQAASHFFIGIKDFSDYEERVDEILDKLSIAYHDEDSEEKVVGTLINFYAQVVHNFALYKPDRVIGLRNRIYSKREDASFYFLKNELIAKVFSIDISNHILAFEEIKALLDVFLDRTNKYLPFVDDSFMIEEGTAYTDLLEENNLDFFSIRNIAAAEYQKLQDQSVYYSLDKGVRVLTSESQLFAYLYSYGKMHYHKIISAFEFLPNELFDGNLEIIDWGCGQALASICFFDYAREKSDEFTIQQITLIEPSEIALRRAALHISKYEKHVSVKTVNKDLDSLVETDFDNNESPVKVHLFSNILDIEEFSMRDLTALIDETFEGVNYFVCASPCINYLRTSRLDSFMSHFSKFNTLKVYQDIDEEKGEWINGWSRCIRVFKANIKK
jgi:hypothetical protein